MTNATNKAYCRLFLATPQCFDLPELTDSLRAAISVGDIASLLISHENGDKLKEAAMALTKLAQRADIAVLIDGDVEIAVACGADGVQISGSKAYGYVREKIGDDKLVGVYCDGDRHCAMSAGEAGADYVSFPTRDDASWWAGVFEVPCVLTEPLALPLARLAVASAIDFICPPPAMWASEAAARDAVKQYNEMIGETQLATV